MTQGNNQKAPANWWSSASENRSWLKLDKSSCSGQSVVQGTLRGGAKIGERRAKS